MSSETEQLAYLAGITDGEGSITAHGRSPVKPDSQAIRFGVTMTDSVALYEFQSLFGGKLYREKRITTTGKPIFTWVIYSRKAANALERLLPYLRVKKIHAQDAIDLARLHLLPGQHTKYGRSMDSALISQREQIYQRIRYRTKHGYSNDGSALLPPVTVPNKEEQLWVTF